MGRICWKGRFWAWSERVREWWMTRVVMVIEMSWQVNEEVSRDTTGVTCSEKVNSLSKITPRHVTLVATGSDTFSRSIVWHWTLASWKLLQRTFLLMIKLKAVVTRMSETLNQHLCAAVHRNAAILHSSELMTVSCWNKRFMATSQTVQGWKNKHTHPQTLLNTIPSSLHCRCAVW